MTSDGDMVEPTALYIRATAAHPLPSADRYVDDSFRGQVGVPKWSNGFQGFDSGQRTIAWAAVRKVCGELSVGAGGAGVEPQKPLRCRDAGAGPPTGCLWSCDRLPVEARPGIDDLPGGRVNVCLSVSRSRRRFMQTPCH
jgi:hypothetical protein